MAYQGIYGRSPSFYGRPGSIAAPPPDDDEFPFTSLRALGVLQILLGFIILGFGIADQVIHVGIYMLGAVPVWVPVLLFIAGGIGAAIGPENMHQLNGLKIGFMVMSVFACLGCLALVVVVGWLHYTVYIMYHLMDHVFIFMIPMVVCGGLGFFISLAAAIVCCCARDLTGDDMMVYGSMAGSGFATPYPMFSGPKMAPPTTYVAPPMAYQYAQQPPPQPQYQYAVAQPQVQYAAVQAAQQPVYATLASAQTSVPAITYM